MMRTTRQVLWTLTMVAMASAASSACSSEGGAGQGNIPSNVAAGAGAVPVTDLQAAPAGAGSASNAASNPGAVDSDRASDLAPTTQTAPVANPAGNPGAMAAGDPTPVPGSSAMDASDPTTPLSDVPTSCRGFEVLGLTHSPGGNVLPNTCAPYHGVFNNPYAIRCIDADPSFSSGYPGDEWCILPPEPGLGTQVKVSPESYTNPEAWFVLKPGEERNDYFYANSTNEEEHFFYRVNMRMRPGSHHMINSMLDADRADGPASSDSFGALAGLGGVGGSRSFPGAQRPDQDRPMSLDVPPENAGLGSRILAHQQFSFNLHHFNLTQANLLREVWINIWYKPESEVTDQLDGIAIFGNPADLNIAPGEHRELHYQCSVQGTSRIVTLNGHRHASTDRFAIWLQRSGGEHVTLYESFDYYDMPTYQYDSITQNPVPSLDNRVDGGYSGMLTANPGDQLHFICDITNRGNQTLRFANEVQTGEMCIVFGSRTGGSLCGAATRVR